MLRIDVKTCLSCAGCLTLCPDRALFIDLEHLKVDQNLCSRCRFCVRFCPVSALSLIEDTGLAGRRKV